MAENMSELTEKLIALSAQLQGELMLPPTGRQPRDTEASHELSGLIAAAAYHSLAVRAATQFVFEWDRELRGDGRLSWDLYELLNGSGEWMVSSAREFACELLADVARGIRAEFGPLVGYWMWVSKITVRRRAIVRAHQWIDVAASIGRLGRLAGSNAERALRDCLRDREASVGRDIETERLSRRFKNTLQRRMDEDMDA